MCGSAMCRACAHTVARPERRRRAIDRVSVDRVRGVRQRVEGASERRRALDDAGARARRRGDDRTARARRRSSARARGMATTSARATLGTRAMRTVARTTRGPRTGARAMDRWRRAETTHGMRVRRDEGAKERTGTRLVRADAARGRGELARRNAGAWKLSDRDYPEGEVVLGIEIRSHSIKAAPVDTANAEFQRPGVTVPIEELSRESMETALNKIANHFTWKGPVGISYTRLALRALGAGANGEDVLASMVPAWKGRIATMIHTEAAAYAEMYFGPGRENSGLVMVCTLGKGFGAVLYNRGQKVRNADFKHLTWTYERELKKLQKSWGWSGVVPPLDSTDTLVDIVEEYGLSGRGWWLEDIQPSENACAQTDAVLAWASLVDRYLQKVSSNVSPERLILLPTGAASHWSEDVLIKLFRPGIQLAGLDPSILVMGEFPDRALVKGAAIGAHIELQSKAASSVLRDAICTTVTEGSELRPLTEAQMDWVFRKLDTDKDGEICEKDLLTGARFFGANLSIAEVNGVMKELHCGVSGEITRDFLQKWWDSELSHSVVTQISSIMDLEDILQSAKVAKPEVINVNGVLQAAKNDKIVVLQCGFSHCRPCKKFEGSYESIARDFPDIRFLKVFGDTTPAAAHLCRDVLSVQSTPDFRIYKGDKLLTQFTGANKIRLEDALKAAIE